MNATNPSSDRDIESLRRAQRAHEPSMEEILASIRSIIADDRETPAASAPPQKPVVVAGPQIVYANDSIPQARTAASTPQPVSAPAPPAPLAAPAAVAPPQAVQVQAAAPPSQADDPPAPETVSGLKTVWEAPAPTAPAPVAQAVETAQEPAEEEPFTSATTEAAVAASFNALSATVAMQSSEVIEGLMREMLRPMLKSWLDDNLPSLVERLVRAEIQRVARGGR
jgi:uncharacterized protein